ncbi:peptide MFS transporter [Lichenicoccus roseus]|uniref:Peptide MFS transporter n=1 Tax=Lichenicoccus roseus TaxID=2683649 RepID=A0A5R9J7M9_9PROT|nr:peptide MFS transporter [Lichenicoccus roseus]TLU73582.1 peptide MFS transporter [Lichenicoccus roseus]
MHATAHPGLHERIWFGHPPGLTILFLTNMWEQFSYYGMRALLVFYMVKELMLTQTASSFIYGAYTSAAYFTPIIGGILSDRILGRRRAIIIGGSIMAAGHFMMTFEPLFYFGLLTIALGNGLFLPSLPAQVDHLYAHDDPRRPWAYSVYYVGVNIGGFLAPLACGAVGEIYGWHYGFAVAGVGMVAGLVIYLAGGRHLPAEPARASLPVATSRPVERNAVLLLVALGLSVTVFRSAYEQVGNTVAIWTDVGIDRHIGHGMSVPLTWFQALNSLFVILFTRPLLAFWQRRTRAGHVQRLARRMCTGALIVGASYLLLALVAWQAAGGRASALWLVGFFALLTLGELFILPTGLGVFARLAPARLGATTVAAWFFTIFSGSLSAGLVGTLWSRMPPAMFFTMLAALAALSAIPLFMLDTPLRRAEADADRVAAVLP